MPDDKKQLTGPVMCRDCKTISYHRFSKEIGGWHGLCLICSTECFHFSTEKQEAAAEEGKDKDKDKDKDTISREEKEEMPLTIAGKTMDDLAVMYKAIHDPVYDDLAPFPLRTGSTAPKTQLNVRGPTTKDTIRPNYYNRGGIECQKVIEAWDLNFSLGNAIKYICCAGHKTDDIEDLKKSRQYLTFEIDRRERRERGE